MPYRTIVSKELAELFGVLAHPHRIRIVEELQSGEKDVGTMAEVLQISHSGVSQRIGCSLSASRVATFTTICANRRSPPGSWKDSNTLVRSRRTSKSSKPRLRKQRLSGVRTGEHKLDASDTTRH
jgi:hypothetical protein